MFDDIIKEGKEGTSYDIKDHGEFFIRLLEHVNKGNIPQFTKLCDGTIECYFYDGSFSIFYLFKDGIWRWKEKS